MGASGCFKEERDRFQGAGRKRGMRQRKLKAHGCPQEAAARRLKAAFIRTLTRYCVHRCAKSTTKKCRSMGHRRPPHWRLRLVAGKYRGGGFSRVNRNRSPVRTTPTVPSLVPLPPATLITPPVLSNRANPACKSACRWTISAAQAMQRSGVTASVGGVAPSSRGSCNDMRNHKTFRSDSVGSEEPVLVGWW